MNTMNNRITPMSTVKLKIKDFMKNCANVRMMATRRRNNKIPPRDERSRLVNHPMRENNRNTSDVIPKASGIILGSATFAMWIIGVRVKPSNKLKRRNRAKFSRCHTRIIIRTMIDAMANEMKIKMFEKTWIYCSPTKLLTKTSMIEKVNSGITLL